MSKTDPPGLTTELSDRQPYEPNASAAGALEIRVEAFTSPRAVELLAGADAYNESLYGHVDQSPIDPEQFEPSRGGTFLIAYIDGVPVACGGFRASEAPAPEGAAEVKRMFVAAHARRQRLGRRILEALEGVARADGYTEMVLDVGRKQDAAHALYEGLGYRRIPGFTIYRDSPGNRAYGKRL